MRAWQRWLDRRSRNVRMERGLVGRNCSHAVVLEIAISSNASYHRRALMDDVELLTAWRAGDERAGERLVKRHYAALERFFVNKAREQAVDLLQRTFLILLEVRDRIQEGGDVRRFLFGIARNVLLDHIRAVYRDGRRTDFGTQSIQDLSPTPNTLILENRRSQELLEALRRLPLDLQIVIELYYWEDMTAPELSKVLEIPEGSVRTKIRRAKEKLAQELSRGMDVHDTAASLDGWARDVRAQLSPRAKARTKERRDGGKS